jgi:hypothetical protein
MEVDKNIDHASAEHEHSEKGMFFKKLSFLYIKKIMSIYIKLDFLMIYS